MSPPPPYSSGKPIPVCPVAGHLDHDVADPLAEVVGRHRLGVLEDRGVLGEVGAHQVARPRRTSRRAGRSAPGRRSPAGWYGPCSGSGGPRALGGHGREPPRGHGTPPSGSWCAPARGPVGGRSSSAGSSSTSTPRRPAAGARRVDHLAAADVERDVVDRRRRARRAPEDQVTGLQRAQRDRRRLLVLRDRVVRAGTSRRPARPPWSGRSSPRRRAGGAPAVGLADLGAGEGDRRRRRRRRGPAGVGGLGSGWVGWVGSGAAGVGAGVGCWRRPGPRARPVRPAARRWPAPGRRPPAASWAGLLAAPGRSASAAACRRPRRRLLLERRLPLGELDADVLPARRARRSAVLLAGIALASAGGGLGGRGPRRGRPGVGWARRLSRAASPLGSATSARSRPPRKSS